MTKEQIEALKADLRTELLQELQSTDRLHRFRDSPWSDIKNGIIGRLQKFEKSYHRYQIVSAIGVIIRHSLGAQNVSKLSYGDQPIAKEIANRIIDAMELATDTES